MVGRGEVLQNVSSLAENYVKAVIHVLLKGPHCIQVLMDWKRMRVGKSVHIIINKWKRQIYWMTHHSRKVGGYRSIRYSIDFSTLMEPNEKKESANEKLTYPSL